MLKLVPKPRLIKYGEGDADATVTKITDANIPAEGYTLSLTADGCLIKASDEAGFFYGEKTLKQIIEQSEALPTVYIEDNPEFAYRGFMLDCSRNFFGVDVIKRFVDLLADLKMNVFHWHLTDDQGWRIQIDAYPLLTEIGSERASTRHDGVPVKGFFTKDDIREVVKYCQDRFITVIPEIDMPGHFTSAIAAYPYIGCTGEKIKVSEHFGIHSDIACAGKATTYEFIYKILDEVMELFPSKYIHLGGDEALKLHWLDCPDCQKAIADNRLRDEEELQGYFMNKMIKYCNAKGKIVINWNDALFGDNLEGGYAVQYWKESVKAKAVAVKEAAKGKGIIYSPFFSYYLDYPYGMTSLRKAYKSKLKLDKKSVIGLEAPLWTEYVATEEKAQTQTFPRLIAVADKSWAGEGDYRDFLDRLQFFNSYLSKNGVKYGKDVDPNFIKGKYLTLKFLLGALDKDLMATNTAIKKTNKRMKQKYGKRK